MLSDFTAILQILLIVTGSVVIALLLRHTRQMREQIAAITQRQDAAGTAERRLLEMFDMAPAGILVTRLSDEQVLYINPKLANFLGGKPGDYVGHPAPAYYAHQADRDQLKALLKKKGSVQDYELNLRLPSGKLVWTALSANIHRFGNEAAVFASIIDIALRKDSEDVLIDVSRSFRELLQSAPAAIMIADTASAEILFANLQAAELIGLDQKQLIGRAATSLYIDPTQREVLVDKLKQGEPVDNVEMEFRRADGRPIWMRISARLATYEGREATIATWDDVTARRLSEQLLRQSENNHRLALASAPFPLIIAGCADRSLLLLNRRAQQALQIPPGTDLDSLIADDFIDAAVRTEIGQMLAGEAEITDREALIRPRSGARFWALISARKIDFEGQPAFILSFTDISEHKRIEREIADSRTALRSMINASPIWMAMFDRGGYYQLVNRPFEALTGRAALDIEGHHFTQVLPGPMATRHAPMFNRCIEGAVVEFEEALESRELNPQADENTTIQIHGKYSPVIAQDGTVSGSVLAMIDISERHMAEQKLKAQFQEINRLHLLLKEQVVRDPLTGLFNRRYLDETLDRELARARREGYPICVIMLDIDHFKRLNDTYGHQAGDEVLKALAKLLADGMREGDMPCRYGGEEFTLVLPNASAAIAHERAEGWRVQFESLVTQFGRFELRSTISLGIAAYPEHGKTRDELIQAADAALYACKKAGRNTTRVHSPEPNAETPG